MLHLERTSLFVAISSLLFCLQFTSCSGFRISQLSDYQQPYYKRSWTDEDVDYKRGGCYGFPCVFTHLGSKASDATIDRIKMSILLDCLNDPHCFTQGRRKRLPPNQAVSRKILFGKRYIANPLQWSNGKRYITNPLQWSTSYSDPTYWKDRRPQDDPYRGE